MSRILVEVDINDDSVEIYLTDRDGDKVLLADGRDSAVAAKVAGIVLDDIREQIAAQLEQPVIDGGAK